MLARRMATAAQTPTNTADTGRRYLVTGNGEDRALPPSPPFLVDTMCGKLAVHLRFCGYDAAYALDRHAESDARVLDLAHTEGRTVVTRDRALAARADRSILLTSRDLADQLRELGNAGVALALATQPTRCGACNGPLERLPTYAETADYAPNPADEPVWRCRSCGQAFWRGHHWERVRETLEDL